MKKNIEILNNDDVISVFKHDEGRFVSGNTLRIKQLLEEYRTYVTQSKASISNEEIFEQSIECEVLRHDGEYEGWRKGKIKFVIQFELEEAENNHNSNSLDDIRQQLDSTN